MSSWRKVLGPQRSGVAQKDAANSLRGQFGTDGTKNAGHGSDSLASAARVTFFFFFFSDMLIIAKEMIGLCVF